MSIADPLSIDTRNTLEHIQGNQLRIEHFLSIVDRGMLFHILGKKLRKEGQAYTVGLGTQTDSSGRLERTAG